MQTPQGSRRTPPSSGRQRSTCAGASSFGRKAPRQHWSRCELRHPECARIRPVDESPFREHRARRCQGSRRTRGHLSK
eukprot:6701138-Alexandrium_andersonii.AAC.1